MYAWNDGAYLAHHGIKGQKWGVRRFQNEDGSLTSAGRDRYGVKERVSKVAKQFATSAKYTAKGTKMAADRAASSVKEKWNSLSDKQRKAIKVGAAIAGTALLAYGAYKLDDKIFNAKLDKANSIVDEGRYWTNSLYNQFKSESSVKGDPTWEPRHQAMYGPAGWNRTIGYIGNDGRLHSANAQVNTLTGTYRYSNPGANSQLGRLKTRDDLKQWTKNYKSTQEKMYRGTYNLDDQGIIKPRKKRR